MTALKQSGSMIIPRPSRAGALSGSGPETLRLTLVRGPILPGRLVTQHQSVFDCGRTLPVDRVLLGVIAG